MEVEPAQAKRVWRGSVPAAFSRAGGGEVLLYELFTFAGNVAVRVAEDSDRLKPKFFQILMAANNLVFKSCLVPKVV